MKLYRTTQGAFVEEENRFYVVSALASTQEWDELICDVDLKARVSAAVNKNVITSFDPTTVLAPVGSQELWAAGVTYLPHEGMIDDYQIVVLGENLYRTLTEFLQAASFPFNRDLRILLAERVSCCQQGR